MSLIATFETVVSSLRTILGVPMAAPDLSYRECLHGTSSVMLAGANGTPSDDLDGISLDASFDAFPSNGFLFGVVTDCESMGDVFPTRHGSSDFD